MFVIYVCLQKLRMCRLVKEKLAILYGISALWKSVDCGTMDVIPSLRYNMTAEINVGLFIGFMTRCTSPRRTWALVARAKDPTRHKSNRSAEILRTLDWLENVYITRRVPRVTFDFIAIPPKKHNKIITSPRIGRNNSYNNHHYCISNYKALKARSK